MPGSVCVRLHLKLGGDPQNGLYQCQPASLMNTQKSKLLLKKQKKTSYIQMESLSEH